MGGLSLRGEGKGISRFPLRRSAALHAYLAWRHPRSQSRETLVDRLWPELDPDLGPHTLSLALSALRKLVGPEAAPSLLVADRFTVGLTRTPSRPMSAS